VSDPYPSKSAATSIVPARRLMPHVKIFPEESEPLSRGSDQRRVGAHFSCLTDTQAALLQEVLAELPDILKSLKAEALTHTRQSLTNAFVLPESVMQQYGAEAWAHEQWHELFLQQTPWISLEEADERCTHTPWDAFEDLLGLAHRGSWHFPLFLFTADGPPDPWWIAVFAALRCEERSNEWKLLAWLLRPDSFLQNRSPLEALRDDPKEVISRAKYATREEQL
jgi:hypothetical protein